jgi:hypothetical protein
MPNLKPIPQEWIKLYVDKLIALADKLPEGGAMRRETLARADHAMDLIKAFRETT